MKIKLLDARGKFSITSLGKIFVVIISVFIILAAIGTSGILVVKNSEEKEIVEQQKKEEEEQLKKTGTTTDNYLRLVYANSSIDETNTVYLGTQQIPVYIGHDTVQEVIDRGNYKVDWASAYYDFYDTETYDFYMNGDQVLTSEAVDELIGSHLYCAGNGSIGLKDSEGTIYTIDFVSLQNVGKSELDFGSCYVKGVRIYSEHEYIDIEFKYMDFDNSISFDAVLEKYGEDNCHVYVTDDEDYVSKSASYNASDFFIDYDYYKSGTSDHARTSFSVAKDVVCELPYSEFVKLLEE